MTGCRSAVLTGPAAAALLGLDGFRDIGWSALACAPHSVRVHPGVIRVRLWLEPLLVEDQLVAHPALVLRHLGEHAAELANQHDGIDALDRIELALEHALRIGIVTLDDLGCRKSRAVGDTILRQVLDRREDEPPAESFAEVRAIQTLRSWGIRCWRQMPVVERGRMKHRVDLVIPYDQRRARPDRLRPADGLLLEIDSYEFHVGRFEEDHQRQTTYDLLGYRWTTVTPNQVRDSPQRVRRAIEQVMRGENATRRTSQRRKVA